MIRWPLLASFLLTEALVAQASAQQPSRTLGWSKAALYMTRSAKRLLRIFLDPEIDYSPWGTFLPSWKKLWPEGDWDSFKQARFHIHANQITPRVVSFCSMW